MIEFNYGIPSIIEVVLKPKEKEITVAVQLLADID